MCPKIWLNWPFAQTKPDYPIHERDWKLKLGFVCPDRPQAQSTKPQSNHLIGTYFCIDSFYLKESKSLFINKNKKRNKIRLSKTPMLSIYIEIGKNFLSSWRELQVIKKNYKNSLLEFLGKCASGCLIGADHFIPLTMRALESLSILLKEFSSRLVSKILWERKIVRVSAP